MLHFNFLYRCFIVLCFNLMLAFQASATKLLGYNSNQYSFSFLENVIQACFVDVDKCIDGKIMLEGRFLLYIMQTKSRLIYFFFKKKAKAHLIRLILIFGC